MPERIQRTIRDAAEVGLVRLQLTWRVWTPSRLVRIIIGLLARATGEACREPARRTVGAEHDVGDRIAGLCPEKPGREYRPRIRNGPFEGERAAVLQHNDNRLADRGNGFSELLLRRRYD